MLSTPMMNVDQKRPNGSIAWKLTIVNRHGGHDYKRNKHCRLASFQPVFEIQKRNMAATAGVSDIMMIAMLYHP